MNTRRIRNQIASLLAGASLTGAFAATSYTLTDLGPGAAVDLNAAGQVVGTHPAGGWYYDGTNRTVLQFTAHEVPQTPGLEGPPYSITSAMPAAISDNGRIVGLCVFPGPPPPANIYGFLYDVGGTGLVLQDSGLFTPYGVSAGGLVVGSHSYFDGTNVVSLPGNDAGHQATVRAVNAAGLMVGGIGPDANGVNQAALFSDGTNALLGLGGLATVYGPRTISEALSVNGAGQIVGYVKDGSGAPGERSMPFFYANGSVTQLGGLGGAAGEARDINGQGVIVGAATAADGTFHAFVFTGGTLVDLNSVISSGGAGWILSSANAVNDRGLIVGEGLKDGITHAFLLTPATDNLPPAINLPPTGTNLFAGDGFTLGVAAAGSGTLTYQWQHAGTNIPGATSVTYTVAHATANDAGSYLVQVSNAFGTTPSASATVVVKVVPDLHVALYAGITLTGAVGTSFRIESVEHVGGTDWEARGNVTLTTSPFFWLDTDPAQHPGRFYRAVPLP